VPHKYFPIDGVSTFVHHTGTTTLPRVAPDTSQGETVLHLHGCGGNGDQFSALLARLSAEHSPIAFDLPAHGRSGELDSLDSIERAVGFVRSFCATLELERPVVFGHASGGALALEYALAEPDRVRALILCSTGAKSTIAEDEIALMRRVSEGKARRPFDRSLFSAATSPEILRGAFMQGMKTDPRATYGDLLAVRDWNAETRLEQVHVPTLVVHGADASDAEREGAEALAAGIAGAKTVGVPKAGHMLPLEQSDALADAMLSFLGELS
jgi:pimeloyl-ACP methyl ester carboxylesterase